MSTTTIVSKSALARVHVEVNDEMLKTLKKAPEIVVAAVKEGAMYWHANLLPRHFESYAHAKYGYSKRTFLTQRKKGWKIRQAEVIKRGKPDLVFTGSLRDDLPGKTRIVEQTNAVQLKMSARVLNFVPNIGDTETAERVTQSNGRTYPNIKREVKIVAEDEATTLNQIVQQELGKRLQWSGQA